MPVVRKNLIENDEMLFEEKLEIEEAFELEIRLLFLLPGFSWVQLYYKNE